MMKPKENNSMNLKAVILKLLLKSSVIIISTIYTGFAAKLIADGFWEDAGTTDPQKALTDLGNIVYHFVATNNGDAKITITTPGFVYDYSYRDLVPDIILYENSQVVIANNSNILRDNSGNYVTFSYSLKKGKQYQVVATTQSGTVGTFHLEVEGPVGVQNYSFSTPLRAISANGNSLSIEQGRAACLYANVDLYPETRPTVTYKLNGQVVGNFHPFPYYINVNPGTVGQYSAVISGGSTSTINLQMLPASTPRNTWIQDEFIITAWYDPLFTGVVLDDEVRVKDWRIAGFGLMFGNGLRTYGNNNSTKNHEPLYLLDRIVAENKRVSPPFAKCLINGSGINFGSNCQNFQSIKDRITLRLKSFRPEVLPVEKRNAILGYFLCDEPTPFRMTSALSEMELIGSTDATKAAIINLSNDYGGWEYYTNYVRTYVKSPWAKVLTSTDYPFNILSSTGYYSDNHFKRLNLYATEIKNDNYRVNLWGLTNCSEDNSLAFAHIPLPSLMMLRYNAFGPIVYGAKGIFWFLYNGDGSANYPHSATNIGIIDPLVYNNLTIINKELKQLGQILMKLKWVGTFHGNATDPSSKEGSLNTSLIPPVNSVTKSKSGSSSWSKDSICISIHTDGIDNYIMVFNKSLYQTAPQSSIYNGYSNKSAITISGLKYPVLFNKSTGKWENINRTGYNKTSNLTSFEVFTDPGDMQLIRLAPDGILPVADLNISSIGNATGTIAEADIAKITLEGKSYSDFRNDNISFAYRQMKSGFEINARVDKLVSAYTAGVMVRSSMMSDAEMIILRYDGVNGNVHVWGRLSDKGSANYLGSTAKVTLPWAYLRMRYYGKTVYCYYSTDGKQYYLLYKGGFQNSNNNYVGLTHTGTSSASSKVEFSCFKLNQYDSNVASRNYLLSE